MRPLLALFLLAGGISMAFGGLTLMVLVPEIDKAPAMVMVPQLIFVELMIGLGAMVCTTCAAGLGIMRLIEGLHDTAKRAPIQLPVVPDHIGAAPGVDYVNPKFVK